jgi:hypothetical protein
MHFAARRRQCAKKAVRNIHALFQAKMRQKAHEYCVSV